MITTTKQAMELITDSQSLVSAKGRFGYEIQVYDDGYGPLFIMRDSMGIMGIVRAQTWEDAYSIAEDEFFPEATETVEELRKDYSFHRNHVRVLDAAGAFVRWETVETPCEADDDFGWTENALFQEAFGFRPNGANGRDVIKHGIYAKDLNGESLELLTLEIVAALEIALNIKEEA